MHLTEEMCRSLQPRTYTEEELSAKLTRRVQKAARRQAKQEELKRLHRAQVRRAAAHGGPASSSSMSREGKEGRAEVDGGPCYLRGQPTSSGL